jgi:hypothetical protein
MNLDIKITGNQIFGFLLMFGVIMLSPFYLYASGLPQPAHILMLVASIAIILINKKYCIDILNINKKLIAFLIYVLTVNIIWYLIYKNIIFIINSLYWIYGFILMMSVLCIFSDEWLIGWIKKLILLQLIFVFISYLAGWGGFTYWPRYEFYFNGPNQLAYFALSMLIVYTTLDRDNSSIGLLIVYFLAICVAFMTGARSLYLAFTPMVGILIYMARGCYWRQFLFIFFPIFAYYLFDIFELPWHISNQAQHSNIGEKTFDRFRELCVSCSPTDYYSIEHQLRARGYLRILDFPQYLLFGAGQGLDERFGSIGDFTYEIHSSLFGVLFYYGITGFILFLMSTYVFFKNKINITLLSPLFVYGLFTYGLRSPYFWVVLGFVALIPNIFAKNNLDRERMPS